MDRQLKKRRLIPVAIALVAIIAVSGVAYAYWTANGSGIGTAAAAPGTTPVTVFQTTSLTGMHPGDTAQTMGGDFTNSGSGPVYVTKITASFDPTTPVTLAVGNPGPCDATDFTLAPTALVGAEIPVGTHVGAWGNTATPLVLTMTIKFNNKPLVNQDGCKGATVNLVYSAT